MRTKPVTGGPRALEAAQVGLEFQGNFDHLAKSGDRFPIHGGRLKMIVKKSGTMF